MGYLSFDIVDLTLPYACLGSMPSRLLFGALWPFAVTSALVIGIAVHALVMHIAAGAAAPSRSEALRTVASRCLYALVFVCYLELPSVSRSIFTAQHCESYAFDDATGQAISFLTADLSMHCNTGPGWTNEAQRLAAYFWSFFVLWPVLVPLGFLALLLQVRAAVRAQRVSSIARSSAFLWRDYDSAHLYWECIDLWRKVCRAQYLSSLSSAVTPPTPRGVTDLSHGHDALHREGRWIEQAAPPNCRHYRHRLLPRHPRHGPPLQARRRCGVCMPRQHASGLQLCIRHRPQAL